MSSPLPLNPKDIDVVNIYLKNGMYNKFDVNSNDLVNNLKNANNRIGFAPEKKSTYIFL